MKIIADENIPYVKQVFQGLGDVTLVSGRTLSARQLGSAELLLVRSVTPVNQALLEDSEVRFVATATIGTDHVDIEYLKQRGIGFTSAPGSNAISAAEYVIASLLDLFTLSELQQKTVAIVGCGNVGSQVLKRLEVLGVAYQVYDPPRQQLFSNRDSDREYVPWEQVLQADVVTAHVPLETGGPYPTENMFSKAFFVALKHRAVFINSARGSVVDEAALQDVLSKRDDLTLVLDVWRNEPTIDIRLLPRVEIATPHIAGYSLDGKVRGTRMVFERACEFFHGCCDFHIDTLPGGDNPRDIVIKAQASDAELISQAVKHAYAIRKDDQRLRHLAQISPDEQAAYFDQLRKQYPVRREYSYFTVHVHRQQALGASLLQGLGFQVKAI